MKDDLGRYKKIRDKVMKGDVMRINREGAMTRERGEERRRETRRREEGNVRNVKGTIGYKGEGKEKSNFR